MSTTKTRVEHSYHPSDLTHGLLAAHCDLKHSERCVVDEHVLARRAHMSVLNKNNHRLADDDTTGLTINEQFADLLAGWLVLRVFHDERTEFLSILYGHHERRQCVLVHRCTVIDSLMTRIGRLSTGSHDIQAVILNEITDYQACGYRATQAAVDSPHVRTSGYALSFSGFSLGAWMAELSVYYCHQEEIGYRAVRAVTFDGPGSHLMLEANLERNKVLGADRFRPSDLDTVAYLSLPNIVNCTNRHIGLVYTVYDQRDEPFFSANDHTDKEQNQADRSSTLESSLNALLSAPLSTLAELTGWSRHDLGKMLARFDARTGRPRASLCRRVISWPLISAREGETLRRRFDATTTKSQDNKTWLTLVHLLVNLPAIRKSQFLRFQASTTIANNNNINNMKNNNKKIRKTSPSTLSPAPFSFFELKYVYGLATTGTASTVATRDTLDRRKCVDFIDRYIRALLALEARGPTRRLDDERAQLRADCAFVCANCAYDPVCEELRSLVAHVHMSDVRDRAFRLYRTEPDVSRIKYKTTTNLDDNDDDDDDDDDDRECVISRMFVNTFLRNNEAESSPSQGVSSLATLDALLRESRAVCIRGQAGSGKSTLASKYARHFVTAATGDADHLRRRTMCFERQNTGGQRQEVTSLFLDSMTRTLFSLSERDTLGSTSGELVRRISRRLKRASNSNNSNTKSKDEPLVLFVLDDLCYAPLMLSSTSDGERRQQQQQPRNTLELMQLIVSEAPACVRFLLTSKLDTRVLYENGLSAEHVEVITLERSRATQHSASPVNASANVYRIVGAQHKQLQQQPVNNISYARVQPPPTWQPDAISTRLSSIGFITATSSSSTFSNEKYAMPHANKLRNNTTDNHHDRNTQL